ncbi:MAG: metal-sensitive transcriptional regulator [Candidatus Sericytochromatia bacterium]|nr:metal-sensitive transcriptional regulator [Candidatus Sericytochromatia bacterium]
MSENKVIQSLRRIEGQVKGLQKMVAEERPCEEILVQIMAAKAALDRVTRDLADSHLDLCFSNTPPDELRDKVAKTIQMLCKM